MIARLALAAALLFGGAAGAQDFKAEWAKLVAAAESEGEIVLYALPSQVARDHVAREWAKAYPKIALSMNVVTAPQLVARIRTERAADKFLWDVAFSGHPAGYILAKEGVIDPLLPELIDPDVRNPAVWGGWEEAFVDIESKYVFSMTSFIKGPYYNASHIPPERIKAQGLKALLDPAYAGKTVWLDPSIPGAGQSFSYFLRRLIGDDGLKTLVVDQKVVFVPQQHQVIEALARGTAWIGMGPAATGLLAPYRAAGMKLDIRNFGTTPDVNDMSIGGTTLYVFNRRPHPNASRLFVNWILGKDIQLSLAKAQEQNSRRRDVPSIAGPDETPIPGATYVATQRENYLKDMDAAIALVRELRQGTR